MVSRSAVVSRIAPEALAEEPRLLHLDIEQISCYERNPRRCPNPEYDRIKASIQAVGLDQPLKVTRRPGAAGYVVEAGGNTRLRILKALHAETGDKRFSTVDCLLVDWRGESDVLLAHLRENELRGDLTFVDRARAVLELGQLLADELDGEQLSARKLSALLSGRGYSVSFGMITLMDYTVAALLPSMPVALEAGLSKAAVARIRQLAGLAREIWINRQAGAEGEFESIFAELCRRHDGPDWQFEPLLQAVEVEIATAAGRDIQAVRMELTSRLAGRVPEIPEFEGDEEAPDDFLVPPKDEPTPAREAELRIDVETGVADAGPGYVADPSSGPDAGDAGPLTLEVAIEMEPEGAREALIRRLVEPSAKGMPLELLRGHAWQMVERLTYRHGLSDLVRPLANNGLGFLLCDVPDPECLSSLDAERAACTVTLWWQLLAFSDQCTAPPGIIAAELDPGSMLAELMADGEQAIDRLRERLDPVLDPTVQGRFWAQLGDTDWCDWLALVHDYRQMHQLADDLGQSLWSAAS